MEVELFALCDYAVNNGGKLTIVGTFDTLTAPKFPWRAYFGVAVKLNMEGEPLVKQSFDMYIYREGDKENRIFEARTPLEPKDAEKMVLAGNIKGLIFGEPARYHYVLAVDDNLLGDYEFNVVLKYEDGKQ